MHSEVDVQLRIFINSKIIKKITTYIEIIYIYIIATLFKHFNIFSFIVKKKKN